MGRNGSIWVPISSKWVQMPTNGSKLLQMDPNGSKLGVQMAQNGSTGSKWVKMGQIGPVKLKIEVKFDQQFEKHSFLLSVVQISDGD